MQRSHSVPLSIHFALGSLLILALNGFAWKASENDPVSAVQLDFSRHPIPSSWEIEAGSGSSVAIGTEGLTIESDYLSSAYFKIPLIQDPIRAGIQMLPGEEEDRWAASLYVVWDENNCVSSTRSRARQGPMESGMDRRAGDSTGLRK
jgi:hypothetical protein